LALAEKGHSITLINGVSMYSGTDLSENSTTNKNIESTVFKVTFNARDRTE
jgi:hypothetical protein